jgi:acyl-CoA reductase-like NAD-dependent aldehyde dehydrogenase
MTQAMQELLDILDLERLEAWLDEQLRERRVEPNSGLGAAIKYMRRHWTKLTLFLREPGAPLDNNVCERALKKAILELGGKDPFIVDDTVDIAKAAALCAEATYANAGQICTSTERIYVQRRVFDQFRDRLVDISSQLRLGDGLEDGIQMGPLVDHLQLEKVSGHVEDAKRAGAEVHFGGARPNRIGYFYPPTVLSSIERDMRLMNEETFGPVAPLISFDDFDEAIALANDSEFGLHVGIYTNDLKKALRAVRRLDFGGVLINEVPTFRADQQPYGGTGDSGNTREGPAYTVQEMTELRFVSLQ